MTETKETTPTSKEFWVSPYKGFSIACSMRDDNGVFNAQAIRFENGILVLDTRSRNYMKKVKLLKAKGRFNVDVFGPYGTLEAAEKSARFAGRDPEKVIHTESGLGAADIRRASKAAVEIDAIRKAKADEKKKTEEEAKGDK